MDKVIDGSTINTIKIAGDDVFRVNVKTHTHKAIRISARSEGEHNDEVVLVANTIENTLNITVNFQPLFKNENDKLSAHKLISTELVLVIPENLEVIITSEIASVELKGKYNPLFIELKNGSCTLSDYYGNARVNTLLGDINVETNFATITSNTKSGDITQEKLVAGNNVIILNSINGNIKVTKRQ
ncbi:hypothetical protein [Lacinutrix salivirga]